jgi:hypothetical protein
MLISSAQDVSVREMVGEIDATAFQSPVQSSIAIHRTYEIQVTIADIEIASIVSSYRTQKSGIFTVPGIVNISLSSGLFDINTTFTIGDIEADEPLDGVVLPRLTFRQWGTSY